MSTKRNECHKMSQNVTSKTAGENNKLLKYNNIIRNMPIFCADYATFRD